jgi:hypothetical protein
MHMLVTMAVMAIAMWIFLKWRLAAPSRKTEKWVKQIGSGESAEVPGRANFDHALDVTSEGFVIMTLKAPAKGQVGVEWSSIVAATAYKKDLITTDLVCVAFELEGGAFVEVHEEMKGWIEFCRAMPDCLPGAARWEQWFMQITTPAFEPCITQLFRRSPSSAADV